MLKAPNLIKSAAILLILVAIAKIISSFGTADLLKERDPIFGLPNRSLMAGIGVFELSIALYCMRCTAPARCASLLLWLGSVFAIYRLGLWWTNYQKPCTCLGTLAQGLGLSDVAVDWMMKGVLLYFIAIGATIILNKRLHLESRSTQAAT